MNGNFFRLNGNIFFSLKLIERHLNIFVIEKLAASWVAKLQHLLIQTSLITKVDT